MADGKKTTGTSKKSTKKKQPATKFEKEDLLNAAESAFGVRRHVLAGALHDVDKPITKKEAEKKLKDFKNKSVKKTRK